MIKVAQCWDDGVLNDIPLTELCRKYNAKATFNLNPSLHSASVRRVPEGKVDGWAYNNNKYAPGKLAWKEIRSVYDGFDVASHAMCHSNANDVDACVFVKEAVAAREILEDLFQKECPGFAWPCGIYTEETADMLLEAGFAYGRTVANTDRVSDFTHPMILHPSCHFLNPEFWNIFEKAKTTDGVFYFWGHSYEMKDDKALWDDFEDKLRRLSQDPDVVWIPTVDLVKKP